MLPILISLFPLMENNLFAVPFDLTTLNPHFSRDFYCGGADAHGYKARDRGPRRRTQQYVEEPDGAQRSRHARIRRRSRNPVRNAG